MSVQIALAFINDACQSSHAMVRVESVFISPSGEWRLGGFDLMSNPTDPAAVLYVRHTVVSSILFTYLLSCSQWANAHEHSNVPRYINLVGACLRSEDAPPKPIDRT
jgi:SCY1-like protein 1